MQFLSMIINLYFFELVIGEILIKYLATSGGHNITGKLHSQQLGRNISEFSFIYEMQLAETYEKLLN